ncbi:MAG: DUF393 domain-containing protein [Bdellovibrionales bacterium]|nr:DUF393 domain-containing protein [Bdellovibrionales bacterium]
MQNTHILYFDGECIFCDSWIQFLYRQDKKKRLLFCALQSDYAANNIDSKLTKDLHTLVLSNKVKNKLYIKSGAVLRVLALVNPIFMPCLVFLLVPKCIRDFIYDIVAKNRYKLFGKKELCAAIPNLDRSRFIVK